MPLTPEQRSENSRKNGRKSKGPTTAAGKRRASMNSVTHGMRATVLATAIEDPQAVAARTQYWFDYYQPRSPAAFHLLNVCVSSSFLSDRCQLSYESELADQVDDTALLWEKERLDEACRLERRLAFDPAEAAEALEGSGHGCRLLIRHWTGLGEAFEARGCWSLPECEEAIRLLGADPGRLAEHPAAYLMVLENLRCQPEPDEACIDRLTRPEHRPGPLRAFDRAAWLPGASRCRESLKASVGDQIDRLVALERERDKVDAAERKRALDRALVLRDEDSARLFLRYRAESRTAFHRAYKDLVATLDREACDEGEGAPDGPGADGSGLDAAEGCPGGMAEVEAMPLAPHTVVPSRGRGEETSSSLSVQTTFPYDPDADTEASTSPSEPGSGFEAMSSPSEPGPDNEASTSPSEPGNGDGATFSPSEPGAGAETSTSPSEPGAGARASTSPSEAGNEIKASTPPSEPGNDINATTPPSEPGSISDAMTPPSERAVMPLRDTRDDENCGPIMHGFGDASAISIGAVMLPSWGHPDP
jgi:hypothetical protein